MNGLYSPVFYMWSGRRWMPMAPIGQPDPARMSSTMRYNNLSQTILPLLPEEIA